MNEYMDILHRIVDDLEKLPYIEITLNEIAEGTSYDYVHDYLIDNGWRASEAYIDFCSSIDFADIEWEVKESFISILSLETSMCTTGKIGIPLFEDVLAQDFWLNNIWDEFNTERGIKINSRLILIDYFEPDISGCICLEATDKIIGSGLNYFNHQTGIRPLDISFKEYFQNLRGSRGIYGWQQALFSNDTEYRKQVDFALKKLFTKQL